MKNPFDAEKKPGSSPRLGEPDLWLDALSSHTLAIAERGRIEEYLASTDYVTRIAAFRAAGRAKFGHLILKRGKLEPDAVILAEAIEQLGQLEYEPAAAWLHDLASGHSDDLVRSAAACAFAEVIGEDAESILTILLGAESNDRVIGSIAAALAWLGSETAIDPLESSLRSSDPIVRIATANLLGYYLPRHNKSQILAMLEGALERELDPAALIDLREAALAMAGS